MSTILDALKKSEQERKLNKVPTLSDMAAPPEASKVPLVLGVVLCVLAFLILTVTVFLWGKGSVATSSLPVPGAALNSPQTNPLTASVDTSGTASDDIIVNVISFSYDLNQRFAMINGKMGREGEFVRAGLQVDKIHMDSVVLNYRGQKIPRTP